MFVEPALAEERIHKEIRTVMRAHEIEREELQKQIQDLSKVVEARRVTPQEQAFLEELGKLLGTPSKRRKFRKFLEGL